MAITTDRFLATLNKTCTIQRKTVTGADEGNQPIWNWTTDQDTDVPCRREIERRETREIVTGQKVVVEKDILYLPAGTDITEEARVILDGETLSVENAFIAEDQHVAHHVEANLRRLKDD